MLTLKYLLQSEEKLHHSNKTKNSNIMMSIYYQQFYGCCIQIKGTSEYKKKIRSVFTFNLNSGIFSSETNMHTGYQILRAHEPLCCLLFL